MSFLEKLEKIRKRVWLKSIIIFLAVGLFVFTILFERSIRSIAIVFIPIFVLLAKQIVILFVVRKDSEKYKKIYRENIVLKCLKNVFEDVEYKPTEDLFEAGLLPEKFVGVLEDIKIHGGICFNDYISAKYNGINFEYVDIEMVGDAGTKPDESQHTAFRGQWLVLELNKKMETSIQICDEAFKVNKKNGLIRGKKYKEIKTNDKEFDKQFKVFVENEVDVLRVLTPNTMDKIKELKNNLKIKLFIYYKSNRLCILVDSKKDLFEPNIYKKLNLAKEESRILNQTKFITELIDDLVN